MTSIVPAGEKDCQLLSEIAKRAFFESHGHSASPEDVNAFAAQTYTPDVIRQELNNEKNIYLIIYHDNRPAGYSKIIFNSPYPNSREKKITKLERLYLLKEFYGLNLGTELFQFNIELARKNYQTGIWLYVWKENPRAVRFYTKLGFEIIGSYDFKLSETHSNPNHRMFLKL